MKHCEDYAALLDPYIDGELSPEDAARVREHLGECDGCRAYVQAAMLLRENFPQIEDTQVPEGFAESVMDAIRSGAAPQKKRRTPWAKVLVPLAACCAIVVLVKSMPLNFTGADAAAAMTAVTEEITAQTDGADGAGMDAAREKEAAAARSTGPEGDDSQGHEELSNQSQSQEDTAPSAQPFSYAAPTQDETAEPPQPQADAAPEADTDDAPQSNAAGTPENGGTSQPESGAAVAPEGDSLQPDNDAQDGETAVVTAETAANDPDAWVEYDNVIFTCTVYLKPAYAGDALAGFEGLPYSSATNAAVTGTGYAMEAAEALHILQDVLDYPLELAENPCATTPLYCIVITDADCAVG